MRAEDQAPTVVGPLTLSPPGTVTMYGVANQNYQMLDGTMLTADETGAVAAPSKYVVVLATAGCSFSAPPS